MRQLLNGTLGRVFGIVAAIPTAPALAAEIIQEAQERQTLLAECAALGVRVDPSLPTFALKQKRDAAVRGDA